MIQAKLKVLTGEGSWTLKQRDELLGLCQRFGLQQSHSSLIVSLYKLQRMMVAEGMKGDEPLIPIIIHESLKRQVSQQDIESVPLSFEVIEPDFRKSFAIGIALISADLCRNVESASSMILQFSISEEDALEKLRSIPSIFKSEQWAIRLRPFLSPANQRHIEDQLLGLSNTIEPTQRLMSAYSAYLKLAFDQGIMPSEIASKPRMGKLTKFVVSHLLCADRMVYKANEALLRMMNGWIRQNILSLDQVARPFQAADRVKHLCPDLLHDPRNFPESWKKTLLVNSQDTSPSR